MGDGGFNNPITGGQGALVRPAIKSPNYAAASAGWSINADGSAEFNNLTARGKLLIGSPPATGAISMGLTGTDIPAVLRNFSPAVYDVWYVANIYWYTATTFRFEALVHNATFGLQEYLCGTYDGTNVNPQVLVDGPGGATDAYHFGSDFVGANQLFLDFRNANVVVDNLSTFNTENAVLNDGTPEVWHAVTLKNGWTQRGGGTTNLKVRRLPGGSGLVQLVGSLNAGTKADGTQVFTLPTGYFPAASIDLPASCDTQVLAQSPHIAISSAGSANCWGLSSASFFSLSAIYPLGTV